MTIAETRTVRIAVVQPALELGRVERNLARMEDLIRDAHQAHAPDAIVVPEGISSPNVYAKVLFDGPRPIDGQPLQLLVGLARELRCVITGGFLAVRGKHAYGTYVMAEPDGSIGLHDKDIPTAWEQYFYRGGDDDGVHECATLGCHVGLMSGWEWARHRTAARVRAHGAGLVLGGMCWPSMPLNWPGPMRLLSRKEHALWRRQAMELPGQVARLTGVPVAHASHVGAIAGETPLAPGVPWRTEMLGESQVCDRDGTILARLTLEDGEGHTSAEVTLAPPRPLDPPSESYWIPELSALSRFAFHSMNAQGTISYRLRHACGGFPWQSLPAADLPDHSGPLARGQAPAAVATAR
jgi:predicted amidohydrolase